MLRTMPVFLVLLALLSFAQIYRVRGLEQQVTDAQQRNRQMNTELQMLLTRFPAPTPDPVLLKQADALQAYLAGLRTLLEQLESGDHLSHEGFSGYFEGLARQTREGVWLRAVRLERGGREIRLTGSALKRDDIPEWMNSLSREPAFKTRTFSDFSLASPERGGDSFEFNLATQLTDTVLPVGVGTRR